MVRDFGVLVGAHVDDAEVVTVVVMVAEVVMVVVAVVVEKRRRREFIIIFHLSNLYLFIFFVSDHVYAVICICHLYHKK
jgi:heme O synthase-like polyprenyltransferase